MDDDQLHRAFAARSRPPPIVAATRYKLDDYRPYLYVTRDYGAALARIDDGIPRGRLHPRHPRRPGAPGTALRRHRDRPLCLVRRWRHLAALPAESAGRADPRPADQGQRPDRRHARPLDLDPGRSHAAARAGRRACPTANRISSPPRDTARVLPGIDLERRRRRLDELPLHAPRRLHHRHDGRRRDRPHLPRRRRKPTAPA